jgi:hypothetical protein
MNIREPAEILKNFLRYKLSEITRSGLSNRQTRTTKTFIASGTATEFALGSSTAVVSINYATVNGVTANMYSDFNIDVENQKITFINPPSTSTNIIVGYDYGDSWIYVSYNKKVFTNTDYPIVVITPLTENKTPQGESEDVTFDTITFQIDVLAFKDKLCTIGIDTLEGPIVAQYMARELVKVLKYQWRSNIINALFTPEIGNNIPIPFDESRGIYRRMIEVKFNAFNAGE